jgi:NitT/TauT family transport system ATP-binding protein
MQVPPLLELRAVGKSFQTEPNGATTWVIRDLSFSIDDGELVTIVGPSGAGKSTLLNLLAQIDIPSSGEIAYRGTVISHPNLRRLKPGYERRIGYVTQDDNLLPWRTCIDNVLFPLEIVNRIDRDARERAAMLMSTVGLERYESYYPHQLSGGMRKRCALIRTLIYDPPIILMDEPFGALDAQTRSQLQVDLLRLWATTKKTIIFVTHDIAEAILLADRTLVLSHAPTRIIGEHQIEIPRPRDSDSLFSENTFVRLHHAIRAQVQ